MPRALLGPHCQHPHSRFLLSSPAIPETSNLPYWVLSLPTYLPLLHREEGPLGLLLLPSLLHLRLPPPPPPPAPLLPKASLAPPALSALKLSVRLSWGLPPPTPHNSVFKFPSLQKQKQNKQEYESRQCRQPPFHLNTGENYRFLGPQPRLQGQAAGDQPRKLGGGGNLLSSMILLREVGKIQPHGCGCVSEPPGALTPSRCCPSFPGAVGGQERAASLASVPALQQASSGRG